MYDLYAVMANRIWSHKWSLLETRFYNGVWMREYNINPALWGTSGTGIGRIGVICHELGHFFGHDSTAPLHATFGPFGIMSNPWGVDGSQRFPARSVRGPARSLRDGPSGRLLKVTHGFPSNEYLLIEAARTTQSRRFKTASCRCARRGSRRARARRPCCRGCAKGTAGG